MKARALSLTTAILILVSACTGNETKKDGTTIGKMCKDSSGAMVNIQQIYGQWKKISGYIDGVDEEDQRDEDFNILIVEKGGAMCQVTITSLGTQAISATDPENYVAKYINKVSDDTLDITYSKGAAGAKGDFATYSFSGDCNNPTMTFSYEPGSSLKDETFRLQTKNVAQETCKGTK
jgi:hypothetical protein